MNRTHKTKMQETVQIKEEWSISSRHYFSISHISSAAIFARESYKLEKEYDGKYLAERFASSNAYAVGTIFMSVSFLEAFINEFFSNCADNGLIRDRTYIKDLSEESVKTIKLLWEFGVPKTARYSVVEKYQTALKALAKPEFEKGKNPCQDVMTLAKLRNALIHYEPEWITNNHNENYEEHEFEKKLKGKFKENPIFSSGNPFYPDRMLGHGCSAWAIETAMTFAESFCERVGIDVNYEHIRDTLNTK